MVARLGGRVARVTGVVRRMVGVPPDAWRGASLSQRGEASQRTVSLPSRAVLSTVRDETRRAVTMGAARDSARIVLRAIQVRATPVRRRARKSAVPPAAADTDALRCPRAAVTAARPRLHPVILRNTVLLALTQALTGAGMQLVPILGAILIERLLGATTFAGLATSLIYASRLVVAYPVGWFTDRAGRRAGITVGLALGLAGSLLVGIGALNGSTPVTLIGLMMFGLGVGANQQLRTAAADMYPAHRRGRALGLVLTGSLIGAAAGPLVIELARGGAEFAQRDVVALAWLYVPIVLLPGIICVWLIRPDPARIAADLALYYPDEDLPVATERPHGEATAERVPLWTVPEIRLASAMMLAAHGIMAMTMALTPLALSHHGHSLTMISLAVSAHVVGMFGLSLPFGWLCDRVGQRPVALAGLVASLVGTLLIPISSEYWVATAGLTIIGMGWCAVNVATTALVANAVSSTRRGQAVGVVDSVAAAASIGFPLLGGVLSAAMGFSALALIASLAMLAPAWALIASRGQRTDRLAAPVER